MPKRGSSRPADADRTGAFMGKRFNAFSP
jgi:hypothetical protein